MENMTLSSSFPIKCGPGTCLTRVSNAAHPCITPILCDLKNTTGCAKTPEGISSMAFKRASGFGSQDVADILERDASSGETYALISANPPYLIEYTSREWLVLFECASATGMTLSCLDTDWWAHICTTPSVDPVATSSVQTSGYDKIQWSVVTAGGTAMAVTLELSPVFDTIQSTILITHFLVRVSSVDSIVRLHRSDKYSSRCPAVAVVEEDSEEMKHVSSSSSSSYLMRPPAVFKVENDTALSTLLSQSLQSHVAIALIDKDGHFIHVNDAWQDVFLYTYVEALDMAVHTTMDASDHREIDRAILDTLWDLMSHEILTEGKTRSGSCFPCEVTMTAIGEPCGENLTVSYIAVSFIPLDIE